MSRKTCHRSYRFEGKNLGPEWNVTDTSSAGTPTKAMHADGYHLAFDNTNEVQNLCLDFGDILSIDIDKIQSIEFWILMNASTKNAAESLAFGVQSARNDDPDATTYNAQFRMKAASTALTLEAETDDGVTDTDDKSTGKALRSTLTHCQISFSKGLSDVRFFVDGQPVCESTTFNMSSATGGIQPFVQWQKTAATSTGGLKVRRIDLDFFEESYT